MTAEAPSAGESPQSVVDAGMPRRPLLLPSGGPEAGTPGSGSTGSGSAPSPEGDGLPMPDAFSYLSDGDGAQPNGSAPKGTGPNGTGPNGTAPHVTGSNGSATNGAATNGSATNGSATNGSATNGSATNGAATNGAATNGAATNGAATNGAATNGAATNGSATNGSATNGSGPNGTGPNGTGPNGTGPNGTGLAEPGTAEPGLAGPGTAEPGLAGPGTAGPGLAEAETAGAELATDTTDPADPVVAAELGVLDAQSAVEPVLSTEEVAAEVAEQLGSVVGEDVEADPAEFAAAAVLDVLRAAGWADATEAAELRVEATRMRELLSEVIRDHRARAATAAGGQNQQLYWLVPLLRAAHGVAFGSLGAKVALRTAVQEVPPDVLATAGLRIDYGVEPAYEDQ